MTNQWSSSSVMQDFEKIAAEHGWITTDFEKKDYVGNPSKSPVGPTRSETTKDYGVLKEEGKDVIEQAHKKSVNVADALGKGGLVENVVEQQEKDLEIATKMPNGALIQQHANLIQELVKIANILDKQGKITEAAKIDAVIEKLARPFVNRQVIQKEAIWPAVPLLVKQILLGLTGAGAIGFAANLGFFSSRQEGISEDIKDLQSVLNKTTGSPSAKKALELLTPFVSKFQNINLSNDKDIASFGALVVQFKPILDQIGNLIQRVEAEIGASKWYEFGFDRPSRIKAKYEDLTKDFADVMDRLTAISEVGKTAPQTQSGTPSLQGISGLQAVLVENKLLDSHYVDGNLNNETIKASKNLEDWLTKNLNTLHIKKSFTNEIIDKNNKLIIEPEKLRAIINKIKQKVRK